MAPAEPGEAARGNAQGSPGRLVAAVDPRYTLYSLAVDFLHVNHLIRKLPANGCLVPWQVALCAPRARVLSFEAYCHPLMG